MNNENMSSGKGLTLVKTTLLPGQERVTVVASLPTNQSCDVTANIPIRTSVLFPTDSEKVDVVNTALITTCCFLDLVQIWVIVLM